MNYYVQTGKNDAWPKEIEIWKLGDPIPEWLSDQGKISFVDGEGNLTLETHETSSGGLEIVGSSGTGALVVMRDKKDYVAYGEGKIFSLSDIQLNLLYKPVITKTKRK